MKHPQAIQALLALGTELRVHGFPVSPEQTILFIQAVGVLGPQHIDHIRQSAIACFSIDPERRKEFDAIFNAIFYGQMISAQAQGSDDEVDAFEPTGTNKSLDSVEFSDEIGRLAMDTERLSAREFIPASDSLVLREFERKAPTQLPRRQSYRWQPARRGPRLDFRATLRTAVGRDGEIIDLKYKRRKLRQRRILLLIDVSGSMKERTAHSLRFAHSLVQTANHAEVFTLGTRLTRVSTALKVTQPERALERVATMVADFDGGTRIGGALQAYLSVPRYSGFVRGAVVVVLSDGLERGGADALVDAIQSLSRMAWRISWLTPLAADPDFEPQTDALLRIIPFLDDLSNGDSIAAMCSHVLDLAKAA